MSTKKRILSDEILGEDTEGWITHLETAVWYEKGGMNYATYKTEPRGYYLAARIEARKREEHVTITKFDLFRSGRKSFLQPAKAFSAKTLAALTPDPEKVRELQDVVRAAYAEKREAK